MRVLISGASIAGPVLAYWLTRRGFDVTVVERAPALRKTGGHAVDLFRPAMNISEQMGVIEQIQARATGTTRMILQRTRGRRPVEVDYLKLVGVISDRHVEIMRDDLSQIYYDAGRDHVEYLFGDQITAIADDGTVDFAQSAQRRYDIVIGADGLHSGVRQLVFGSDAGHSRFLGGYLAVLSVPKELARDGEMTNFLDARRWAMIYTADHLDDARAVFLFRPEQPLEYHHRDDARQRALLRAAFTGLNPTVDRWLAELDGPGTFYFDSITQLELTSWSRGRVTLVGDAGYCPGPAVGGSTSLAVLGAYVLAGELERAGGDHVEAFANYEAVMADPVRHSRAFARTVAKSLVPRSELGVWALVAAGRVLDALPAGLTTAVAKLNNKGIRLYDAMGYPDYPVPASAID
ncbi:2-polyprenyl-6-methoxyphenol hydroxylase-like FAD-dependent oxidoreductase [Mycolicibacterium sp. BK556]|uniref:FAD-dependent monooxygenase n=1 Tax=unclassified Mycolicibacterium TaxID=2636767 RepID=UPI0016174359|nr:MULTISPECIES: FAD-dependent monooxygenase [unclassified Mycolicibacterium]MBB3604952.1 2-polyprenyl-6-methoxyphenol hydroxylase-like FAD-dependent oxidoreductase [Mycolicibacterium sp. BK556]MBB3635148.1 2-polyprenyl-6-methoxyphenol hydroxylase-like FAD-dependent oxidoreductase [Mycolicibacterium sp. BK607]